MKASKNILVVLLTGASVIAQLLSPTHAFADGETTPPPVETIKTTEPPAPTDTPKEVDVTETPVVSDVPTVEPVSTEIPAITTAITEIATEVPVIEPPEKVTDEPTLLEIVEEIPAETDLVVLDAGGQPLSLSTQDTAEIVAAADPVWCPAGQAPTPGANGCSASFGNLSALVSGFVPTGNGTIWIETGADSSASVTINGNTTWFYANSYALTLQGGWDGTPGSTGIASNSVFTIPISILNWLNSVAIFNIDAPSINISNVDVNGGGNILVANTLGDVNINNVAVDGGLGFGLYVDTHGRVRVTNSSIRYTVPDYSSNLYAPYGDGADIFSNGGDVIIDNSDFVNHNIYGGEYGLWVSTGGTGDLTVRNSTFDGNYVGLVAFSSRDLYVFNDNTFQNNNVGLAYYNCSGNLLIEQGITFTGNISNIENWDPEGCAPPVDYVSPASTLGISTRAPGKFTLDCSERDGFSVPLPNGDLVQIFCPVSGEAEIARLDNTILPKTLPDGYTFASAFELNILQSQKPIVVINDSGFIRASFIASALNNSGNIYSILYWDPIEEDWVVLKDYMNDGNTARSFYLDPEDPTNPNLRRKIVSGVQVVTSRNDERVEVSTNFPGIFVLAQH